MSLSVCGWPVIYIDGAFRSHQWSSTDLTHSEWDIDSKFVGLLKVGYHKSILENCVGEGSVELYW